MADQRLSDEEIQFRQKARQRLIGAVTLMMAAVVVLPWALDGKPRVPTHEIAVYLPASAPSSSPALSSNEQVASLPAAPAASAAAAASPAPAPAQPGMTAPAPGADAPVAAQAARATGAPPREPAAERAETPAAAAKTAPAVRAKPVQTAHALPVRPVQMAHAHPHLDATETQPGAGETQDAAVTGKPARPPVTSGYVLQLGTFSEADNARQLKARLAAKGVPAFTEHLASPGGDRIRVRVGPYPSRAAAEQALSRVNALGLSGVVLNAH